MSAGPIKKYFYEMENGMKTRVRLQEETVAAKIGTDLNGEATGPKTAGIPSAKVSLNDGEIGIRPRYVSGKWVTVPANSEYVVGGFVKIVVPDPANFAIFTEGAVMEYLGGTFSIERQVPEQIV